MTTFENQFNVISVADVIARFLDRYSGSFLTKVQLEYQGPFLKYDLVGQDQAKRYSVDINAQTGEVIRERDRPLKGKALKRARDKQLNLDNLLDLTEIHEIALENLPVDVPIQWELDRKKQRTVWKVEMADQDASKVYEIKIDAQDGTVLQTKLKG